MIRALLHLALLVLLPPLLIGLVGRVKSIFAGRRGPPVLQPWRDIVRLLRKGAVYGRGTTWVFRAGPVVSLAATLAAGLVVPLAGSAPLAFEGDLVFFAYALGLARLATMAAALDTGSSFEGMGASREAAFSALAEPALLLALAVVATGSGLTSLGPMLAALPWTSWGAAHPQILLAATTIFIVLLVEGARIPVDDPATHLELTMVHEVMVLDHSGPDLAFILHAQATKIFLFGAIVSHLLLPIPAEPGLKGLGLLLAGEAGVAAGVGVVESTMARLRLSRVPQLVIGASVIAACGLVILFYRGRV